MWRWLKDKIKSPMLILGYAIGAGIALGLFRWEPTGATIFYLTACCVVAIIREVRR